MLDINNFQFFFNWRNKITVSCFERFGWNYTDYQGHATNEFVDADTFKLPKNNFVHLVLSRLSKCLIVNINTTVVYLSIHVVAMCILLW